MNATQAAQAEQQRELAALRLALRTIHNIANGTASDDRNKVLAIGAVTDQYYGWRAS